MEVVVIDKATFERMLSDSRISQKGGTSLPGTWGLGREGMA